jgi:hypothetical protein
MEFITNNEKVIMKYYRKQIRPHLSSVGELQESIYFNPLLPRTSWVNDKTTNEIKMKTDILPVLIQIKPLMSRQLCHHNCDILDTILNKSSPKYEWILGYNFTSCPCGTHYVFELHSVMKHIETGKYIDLTADMYAEESKWFLPLIKGDLSKIQYIKNIMKCDFWESCIHHSCNGRSWGHHPDRPRGNLKEFVDSILELNDIEIYL